MVAVVKGAGLPGSSVSRLKGDETVNQLTRYCELPEPASWSQQALWVGKGGVFKDDRGVGGQGVFSVQAFGAHL